MAIDDVSAWESEFEGTRSAGGSLPEDADSAAAAVPDPARQELLWGQRGGVVLIVGILIAVVVVLTVTVGALPL